METYVHVTQICVLVEPPRNYQHRYRLKKKSNSINATTPSIKRSINSKAKITPTNLSKLISEADGAEDTKEILLDISNLTISELEEYHAAIVTDKSVVSGCWTKKFQSPASTLNEYKNKLNSSNGNKLFLDSIMN